MDPTYRTLAERQFDVADSRGRIYRVTRYVWQADAGNGWTEADEMLLTVNGGVLDRLGEGRFCIDGTGTLVELVPGSERTEGLDPVRPADATGTH
jgi:hypothetical protein